MSAQSPCMHPQTVPRALPPETTNHETFGPRILPARTPVTPPTLNLNQHLAIFFFLSSSTTVASARVRFPFRDLDCGPFFASLLKCHLVSNKFFPHHHNPFLPATPTLYQHLSQLILS